ncbi:MAG: hypothetical protein LBU91_01660 [Bacteroidales bacterium]|nr:hypothetical protein [Bacteroidales bacterium]
MTLFIVSAINAQQMKVAVLDFKAGAGIKNEDAIGISGIFSTYFMNFQKFTLVERTQIDRVIREQGFQYSLLTNQQMVKVGQILNVQKIVVGDINVINGEYNVDVRIVDVETGIVNVADGTTWLRGKSYRDLMSGLANQLMSKMDWTYIPPETPKVVEAFAGCSTGLNLGRVSFVSSQTWSIGNQIWSDVVQATGCSKATYYGGKFMYASKRGEESKSDLRSDCRSNNPNYDGDLFSWCTVACYGAMLCPSPWRVPTVKDFIALGKALGGTGSFTTLRDKYLNTWGGAYGGYCNGNGNLSDSGSLGYYWSSVEASAGGGYVLLVNTNGFINSQSSESKYNGFSLRCVR